MAGIRLEQEGVAFDMRQDIEQRIRGRACLLREREGRTDGRTDGHRRRAGVLERVRDARERRVDAAGEDSFPAGDPPSYIGMSGPRLAAA